MLKVESDGSFLPLGHTKTVRNLEEVPNIKDYVVTRKRDGVRAFLDFATIQFIGRRGVLVNLSHFASEVIQQVPTSTLKHYKGLDGELVHSIHQDNLGFVTGQCNAKVAKKELHFKVFDGLLRNHDYGYRDRFNELGCFLLGCFLNRETKISLVSEAPRNIADSCHDIENWCNNTWEGLILRDNSSKFRAGRQKAILKYKPRVSLRLTQKDFVAYHISTKLGESISRLEFAHPYGKNTLVSISTGFKQIDRIKLFHFFNRYTLRHQDFYIDTALERRHIDASDLNRATVNASFVAFNISKFEDDEIVRAFYE